MCAHIIRKALIITATVISMIPHLSHASDAPLEVSKISSPGSGFDGIIITSLTDEITLTNVLFNRRKCRGTAPYGTKWPAKLGFGDTQKVYGMMDCKLIEVEVITDKGNWTFRWK